MSDGFSTLFAKQARLIPGAGSTPAPSAMNCVFWAYVSHLEALGLEGTNDEFKSFVGLRRALQGNDGYLMGEFVPFVVSNLARRRGLATLIEHKYIDKAGYLGWYRQQLGKGFSEDLRTLRRMWVISRSDFGLSVGKFTERFCIICSSSFSHASFGVPSENGNRIVMTIRLKEGAS